MNVSIYTMRNFVLSLNYTDGWVRVRTRREGNNFVNWISRGKKIRFSLKEAASRRLCEKSSWILKLEKDNSGFTLLCTWMTQFRRWCDVSYYGAFARDQSPAFTLPWCRAPRSFANEWMRDIHGGSWFSPATISLTFFFHVSSLWISRASAYGSRHNAIMRVVWSREIRARFRERTRPIGSHVNEPFTSSSFQRSTFWFTISSRSISHAETPNYDTLW